MASLVVASFVNVAAATLSFTGACASSSTRNYAVTVKMAPIRSQAKLEEVQRRAMIVGVAAAALALVSSVPALAGGSDAPADKGIDKPKPGSKEAKKEFANICVSQPTASICHG